MVSADPSRPPHSLKYYLAVMLAQGRQVFTSVHFHSSVTAASGQFAGLADFLAAGNCDTRTGADVVVTLIWKRDPRPFLLPSLVGDPGDRPVCGEVNVGRYFGRILGLDQGLTSQKACQAEEWLDRIQAWSSLDAKKLGDCLKDCLKSDGFLGGGGSATIADVHLLSLAKQANLTKGKNIDAYRKRCIANNPLLSNSLL